MVVGNPQLSLEVEHSSTRIAITTISGHGDIKEQYILDGIVRTEMQSGEAVMLQASVDDTEAIVVEKRWDKRKMSTIDRRELTTRTRLVQVRWKSTVWICIVRETRDLHVVRRDP